MRRERFAAGGVAVDGDDEVDGAQNGDDEEVAKCCGWNGVLHVNPEPDGAVKIFLVL